MIRPLGFFFSFLSYLILILTTFTLPAAYAKTELKLKPMIVMVFGNKSIKEQVIIEMTGLNENPEMELGEVKQRLQTTGLFKDIEVARHDNIITIYLKEKTTWFIVPYFSQDPASRFYGLAFGQATLFGQDAALLGRYQVGTGTREASILMKDQGSFKKRWKAAWSLDFEDSLHRIFRDREVVHRTTNQYHGGSFQAGFQVTPYFSLNLNNYMERHRYEELDGRYLSGFQWSHRFIADYSQFYVDEGLSEGSSLKGYFEVSNPISTFHFYKLGTVAQKGMLKRGNFNWIVRGKMEFSPSLPRYQLFEIGGGKLRGFPTQMFRDRYYTTIQNDLLLAVFDVWKLKFRPMTYLDWAFIQSEARTALGTGIQMYFHDVAIPALQISYGYGFNPNGWAIAASIGPQL